MNIEAILTADVLRSVTLLMGGIAFGLALSESKLYWDRLHSPSDPWYGHRRLRYMVVIRLGIAMLVSGVTAAIALRLGEQDLAPRTPFAFVAFCLLVWGMWGILREDETLAAEGYRGPKRRSTDDPEMGSGS